MHTVVGCAAADTIVVPYAVTDAVRQTGNRNWLAVVVVGARRWAAIFVAAIGCAKWVGFSQRFRCRGVHLRAVDERATGGRIHRCGDRDRIGTYARGERPGTRSASTDDLNRSAGLWRARPVGTCCAHRSQAGWQLVFDHNCCLRRRWAVVPRHEAVRHLADAWRVRTGTCNRFGDREVDTLHETEVNRHVAGGIQTTVGRRVACCRTADEIRLVDRLNEERAERYNVTCNCGCSIGGTVVVAVEVAVRCCA